MPDRFFYKKRHRLKTSAEFAAVFNHKARKTQGPLTIFAKPNTLNHHRLGLSVGKRVGNAVARGKAKRMIRDAFRHEQHNLPKSKAGTSYDLVVTLRPHDQTPLQTWQSWFSAAATAAIKVAQKREQPPQESETQPAPNHTPKHAN